MATRADGRSGRAGVRSDRAGPERCACKGSRRVPCLHEEIKGGSGERAAVKLASLPTPRCSSLRRSPHQPLAARAVSLHDEQILSSPPVTDGKAQVRHGQFESHNRSTQCVGIET
jgi:hypothetical protein